MISFSPTSGLFLLKVVNRSTGWVCSVCKEQKCLVGLFDCGIESPERLTNECSHVKTYICMCTVDSFQ